MGEEEQYYIRDHHEAIVSREVWDEAERIRLKRNKNIVVETTGNRNDIPDSMRLAVCVNVLFVGK